MPGFSSSGTTLYLPSSRWKPVLLCLTRSCGHCLVTEPVSLVSSGLVGTTSRSALESLDNGIGFVNVALLWP